MTSVHTENGCELRKEKEKRKRKKEINGFPLWVVWVEKKKLREDSR